MIAAWWSATDSHTFPDATRLQTLCDGGGSNGWRSRLWKVQLPERLADLLGLRQQVVGLGHVGVVGELRAGLLCELAYYGQTGLELVAAG